MRTSHTEPAESVGRKSWALQSGDRCAPDRDVAPGWHPSPHDDTATTTKACSQQNVPFAAQQHRVGRGEQQDNEEDASAHHVGEVHDLVVHGIGRQCARVQDPHQPQDEAYHTCCACVGGAGMQ